MTAFSGAFVNLINHILLELSELYIYCWFSSKLTEHAENVGRGIFYSQWYNRQFTKSNNILRFTIMRCNRPITIKAAKVLPISIRSYIWILQQSYSFFMVLRTVRTQ
ncbi:hypothetical protein FQA39_LY07852 [Lamprigera yunnana]|nr:hypothetical protein FQA39_LY07852 [Lamprigera yunnana]